MISLRNPLMRMAMQIPEDVTDTGSDIFRPITRERNFSIPVNVYETETEFTIVAEIPGVEKNKIGIEMENRLLKIKATRDKDAMHSATDATTVNCELGSGYCQRTVNIPLSVDQDASSCSFTDGLLRITFPKHAPETGVTKKLTIA